MIAATQEREPERRCPQCWRWKPEHVFVGQAGKVVRRCADCRARYDSWDSKTPAERLAAKAKTHPEGPADGAFRAVLIARSGNRKTGPIPVSMTSGDTCPPTCAFFNAGCYAEFHLARHHWANVSRTGLRWSDFCEDVARLPEGQLWRHNEAGDLPGDGHLVDAWALHQLVQANRGKSGFTFTHYRVLPPGVAEMMNRGLVAGAVRRGFTVNLSADSLEEADALHALGIAPVVVVVPSDAPARLRTPAGRHVTLCPAETNGLTCEECRLCANPGRESIVGFRAHGQMKRHVSELVQLRRGRAEGAAT